jgi:hypothetical protein
MNHTLTAACLATAFSASLAHAQLVTRARNSTRPLDVAASVELERLNANAQTPFTLARSSRGDALDLSGGAELAPGPTRAASTELWIAGHRALLSLPPEFELQVDESTAWIGRARASFTHMGLPVLERYVTVTFDSLDRVRAVHAFAPRSSAELGAFLLTEDAALAAARDYAIEHMLALGRDLPASWRAPTSQQAWESTEGGLVPVWRVREFSQLGDEGFALDVDARNGALRRVRALTTHGSGKYPFFGNFVPFNTGTAKGVGFKDVPASLLGHVSNQSLKSWALGVPAPVSLPKGFLIGSHVEVVDANDLNLFASNGKFTTLALSGQDAFDQSNAYFQIEDNYAHLRKDLGFDLQSNFALPFVVNFKSTTPNAFFTQAAFPDGHVDGFMLFFDLDPVVGPAGDFSRDPTAVDHEYTHGWVHYEGEDFDGDLNFPTRAVGEAIADFYALAKQNDTFLGRYIDAVFPALGIGRNLHDDDYFANTLADAIALTGDGMPEEHRSGETFGSLMTDVRLKIGAKNSERLWFAALAGMPNTMDEIGFPTVDATNAEEASADYFGTCVFALFDAASLLPASSRAKAISAVLGAATARGVLGSDASTMGAVVDLSSQSKGKITIPSAFHDGGEAQTYFFSAPFGKKLAVKIQDASGSFVLPDFVVRGEQNEVGAVVHTHAKTFSGDHRTVGETNMLLSLPGNGIYEIDLVSTNGAHGDYTLTLDI